MKNIIEFSKSFLFSRFFDDAAMVFLNIMFDILRKYHTRKENIYKIKTELGDKEVIVPYSDSVKGVYVVYDEGRMAIAFLILNKKFISLVNTLLWFVFIGFFVFEYSVYGVLYYSVALFELDSWMYTLVYVLFGLDIVGLISWFVTIYTNKSKLMLVVGLEEKYDYKDKLVDSIRE